MKIQSENIKNEIEALRNDIALINSRLLCALPVFRNDKEITCL